ncbi:ENR1 protein, partial [Mionectes macconnelli]|nr:ENR1 protein [Mionectes macconnelli]
IIQLQVVIEVTSNQTTQGLELLAHQQTQSKAAIDQNQLALDYLLADEGGVRGKF